MVHCQLVSRGFRLCSYWLGSIVLLHVIVLAIFRHLLRLLEIIIIIFLFLPGQEGREELISFLILLSSDLVQRILHGVDFRRRKLLPSQRRYPLLVKGCKHSPHYTKTSEKFVFLKTSHKIHTNL
jgi:hypothetical protein